MFLKTPPAVETTPAADVENQPHASRMRQGETCPRCGSGKLDYNGLLDLECPVCGYTESAGGGCT